MKVGGAWLENKNTQAVMALLSDAGYQALAVGGCVRNTLLGEPVVDVDIATDALPETVTNLAENAGLRAVPTGIAHGTVTVVAGGEGFEVTSFRHDEEGYGRHARVAFGADLFQDAQRRDFTMNALYARADGTVVDPLGGLQDLRARRLRFVGEAQARITEDYLRILRFFRFHAQYGDPAQGLDAEALAACAAHSGMLEALSAERITSELRKLLAASDPAPAVAAMAQSGVLNHILMGAQVQALPILVHFEDGRAGGWLRRLAVLGGAAPEARLRMTKAEIRHFSHVRDALGTLTPAAALGYLHGAEIAEDIILARAALFETPPPEDWQHEIARGVAAVFPLKPKDLMPALTGPALGSALKAAQAQWIAQDFAPDGAALIAWLDKG
ncbi:CCA tRNA nucleotidyltransferase [Pararhodobacter oceanensis]|uniref:CCA tRNA nucleotidyltransferase n=1 Tax=Pararhodobacter oceanensis TaxID=2172121 RepID=UPI003A8DF13C